MRAKRFSCFVAALLFVGFGSTLAVADETVTIGGSRSVLIKPNAPRASVILMAGGDGAIRAGDHGDIHGLHRQSAGPHTARLVCGSRASGACLSMEEADLSSAIQYMATIKRPVTVIATSLGTIRAAQGIARGARPDALVLTSGWLSQESWERLTISCRLLARQRRCHARSSFITVRIVAHTHCRPESNLLSSGRLAGRGSPGGGWGSQG